MSESRQVFLEQYTLAVQAELARSFLSNHGVESFIRNEHIVSINQLYSNAVGGVRLYVLESDFEKAKNLLSEVELGHHQLKEDYIEGEACPQCGVSQTERMEAFDKGWAYLLLYFTGIPFLFLNHERYRCLSCKHQWKVKQATAWYYYLVPIILVIAVIYFLEFTSKIIESF